MIKLRTLGKMFAAAIMTSAIAFSAASADKKPFTFTDIMKFKVMTMPAVSDDGKWIVYGERPERGDADVIIQNTFVDSVKQVIRRASKYKIARSGEWVAVAVPPKSLEIENLEKGADRPKTGMKLIHTSDRQISSFDNIDEYEFSNDSKWFVYRPGSDAKPDKKKKTLIGQDMVLRFLETGAELTFNSVYAYAIDSTSSVLAYSVAESDKKHNGLFVINLKSGNLLPAKISDTVGVYFTNLSWDSFGKNLAYICSKTKKNDEPDSSELKIWRANELQHNAVALALADIPQGYFLPVKNKVEWTRDGERIFFGIKPGKDTLSYDEKVTFADSNFYDEDMILKKVEGDVWHWNDQRVKTVQKVWWRQHKDRTFLSVYRVKMNKTVFLADSLVPDVAPCENPNFTIAYSDIPYLKESQWEGDFQDIYAVNLMSGEKKIIKKHMSDNAFLSPGGKFAVYYNDKQWYLYEFATDTSICLTQKTGAIFYNDEHDTPSDPESFGIAGWLENDEAVLINSKYDIFKFYTSGNRGAVNITGGDGLTRECAFRARRFDPDREYFKKNETLYLTAIYDKTKENVFFAGNTESIGTDTLIYAKKRFNYLTKAKNANRYFFTREEYNEFPDVWVCDSSFKNPRKITDMGVQMKDFLWGTPELVSWTSKTGDKLQGFIIKPENFDPAKRYPVVTYFYERYSDSYYFFAKPYTGHRLCWQQYAGDGYVMFVPDIVYKTGRPGESALNCLLPGLRMLIDRGIADSNGIGIWGHSWSGYQTAYLINATNIFRAAVAGATVGNMTSAYSGIRWESGRPRQFQYEHGQSRIGGNLWDSLPSYIDNSPIFGAKKARTPLLIMAGDEDQMVPWQQSLEIYFAMRRLDKNCIFLQYRGEPHWPEKYPNRLDYAKKIKDFYDTYLKDKPAPSWILDGVEYKGK